MATRINTPKSNFKVSTFELPLVEGPVITDGGHITVDEIPTARNLEALFEEAHAEGLALGRAEGLAQGQKEIADQVAVLEDIVSDLAQPLQAVDDEVVESISDLAILIAKTLVRRELKTEPGEIVAVVRETIKHLPLANREVRIYLNPEDITLVETALSIGERTRGWCLESDPAMTRGGCVVKTDVSHIDATVEGRLSAIVNQMFGGEREHDH